MATQKETKLDLFLQWLQVNRVELRGCEIKYCDSNKGFGLFSTSTASDVLLVVPLNLAITPMRVLDDPLMGPICRAKLKEGEVDDRFLIILFLILERLRSKSLWKPYLDMIPRSFGSPLWFTDSEFHELKGTTIYQATILQKKSLHDVFEDKVKDLVKQLLILDGEPESEVAFEDFLWANSVFWTRALNIPLPRTFVFPEECEKPNVSSAVNGVLNFVEAETLWVEGLVPGIDFCNHALKAAATWEVDSTGSATGVPFSMYLQSVNQGPPGIEKEVTISYGNKGNEELLYLYGFVIEDNPDDFLMVHYPADAVQSVPFSDSKTQLLQAQKAELRCLLPKHLLDRGFFPSLSSGSKKIDERASNKIPNYSWSGQRKIPSYVDKLVFPEEFLTSLRTIAMQENELFKVKSLLEELVGNEGERELSDDEVRAAVWEACGDAGAFQLLVDMLNTKLIDLEEGSGTEESDSELLNKTYVRDGPALPISADKEDSSVGEAISKNRWASIVYRRGQKQLARLFLREAEQALQLCLAEEC
ncbi:ribulose-1,5 bisphosphate carboxylase/oxygenase large subunit N-methyltransferase, chloroplastic isoform X2 [Amaranthus tricolor]|uniref:ribulose-1,5 bisphosphate carboxylase/oxygenase large subunit N-methyltransferase, chloroplastic isoform X2 n=1 Tax=Amaranthus tricolor TaxID=29722 RepID=UPI00258CE0AA|nr:ribulose-1,5 bisphosphate carboxylase/oxygenase large subunit N-methyltransferase, chloroplastic isoform X2 [Amaranthus tricolor]